MHFCSDGPGPEISTRAKTKEKLSNNNNNRGEPMIDYFGQPDRSLPKLSVVSFKNKKSQEINRKINESKKFFFKVKKETRNQRSSSSYKKKRVTSYLDDFSFLSCTKVNHQ
jgi:hypothetical protein